MVDVVVDAVDVGGAFVNVAGIAANELVGSVVTVC